jgi:hypothetical protein
MSEFDDRPEHQHRRKMAFLLGPLAGIAAGYVFYADHARSLASLAWWIASSPWILGATVAVYGMAPYKQGRLGSRSHGDPPQRLLRPGNPVLRQSSGAAGILMVLFVLSFVGCVAVLGAEQVSMATTALPMMYVSLAVIFGMLMSTTHWIELDVDSLRILRHRVTFGLQRTTAEGSQAVRALAACRCANSANFNVFAFTQDGHSLPLSQEKAELKEIQFEAERLSDQLMVPLLVGVDQQNNVNLARSIRSRSDDQLPVRRDWAHTEIPASLSKQRSLYPPID